MKLWLDDLRNAPDGWRRSYCVADAIRVLLRGGAYHFDEVSLDNDLGAGEPEGYVVAEFIAFAARYELLPRMKLAAHTQNEVAKKRMEQAFAEAKATWDSKGGVR